MGSIDIVPNDKPTETSSKAQIGWQICYILIACTLGIAAARWFIANEDAHRAWFGQEVEVSVSLDAGGDYVLKYIRDDIYPKNGTPHRLVKCSKNPCTFKIDRQAYEFTFARNTTGNRKFYPDKVKVSSDGQSRDLKRRCWQRFNDGWETNYTWCDYTLVAVPQPEE